MVEWGNLRNWLSEDARTKEQRENRELWNEVERFWRDSPFGDSISDVAMRIFHKTYGLHDPSPAGPIIMAMGLAGIGLSAGAIMPWAGAMVMRLFGAEAFARVFGLLALFLLPANFAPILFGWIRDTTGGYQVALLGFAGLVAAGGFSLMLIRQPISSQGQTNKGMGMPSA